MPSTLEDQTSPFGGSWLSVLPAALTVVGIVLFGVLNLGYSLFYDRLGVTPDAVALSVNVRRDAHHRGINEP